LTVTVSSSEKKTIPPSKSISFTRFTQSRPFKSIQKTYKSAFPSAQELILLQKKNPVVDRILRYSKFKKVTKIMGLNFAGAAIYRMGLPVTPVLAQSPDRLQQLQHPPQAYYFPGA